MEPSDTAICSRAGSSPGGRSPDASTVTASPRTISTLPLSRSRVGGALITSADAGELANPLLGVLVEAAAGFAAKAPRGDHAFHQRRRRVLVALELVKHRRAHRL